MERDACHQSLLHKLQGPQEWSPPLGSLHRVPIERYAVFMEPSFNYQSYRWMDRPWFLTESLWRKVAISRAFSSPWWKSTLPNSPAVPPQWVIFVFELSSNILPDPQKRSPPLGSPNRAPAERDAPLPGPFYHLLKFPVNWTPPQVPQWAPTERDTGLQSLLLHIP